MARQRVCIIGIGNEDRGDDGVGLWVVRQVRAAVPDSVAVAALGSRDGTALLSAWEGKEAAYVVDAAAGGFPSGAIVRLDGLRHGLASATSRLSSHGIGLLEALALGRTLGLLPGRLIVYAIVGRQFGPGHTLSPEVKQAGRQLVRRLCRMVTRRQRVHA